MSSLPPAPSSPASAPARTAWAPLLAGSEAQAAWAVVESVAAGILAHRRAEAHQDPGLAAGLAGDALFLAQLSLARPEGPWAAQAQEALSQAVGLLAEQPSTPMYYSGFSGIAWAAERLQRVLSPGEGEDLNGEIDEALLDYLSPKEWRGQYDLIIGLVGLGTYALERMERPGGRALLERVIDHLEALAQPGNPGLTWVTPPEHLPDWQRKLYPQGYLNLGLAHGVPGVIAFFGDALRAGVARVRPLLEGAVAWTLAQENVEGAVCGFGTAVPLGDGQGHVHESRLAWCYGDLGLGVALLGAARNAGRRDWEEAALRICLRCARRPMEGAGVRDAGLCHGAAGNGHIFNRLWQATGEPDFRAAAEAWFRETLTFADPAKPLAGIQSYQPNMDDPTLDPHRDAAGLLEGSIGVALALLAAVDGHVPTWDRLLLVDLPTA